MSNSTDINSIKSRIKLTGVKICKFASEETTCFQATIQLDGVAVGSVDNDGRGGSNSYHPWQCSEKLDELVKDCSPLIFSGTELKWDADLLIDEVLQAFQEEKQLRTWCKKKTLFVTPDTKKGTYRQLTIPYDGKGGKAEAFLKAKYPQAEIINERFLNAANTERNSK